MDGDALEEIQQYSDYEALISREVKGNELVSVRSTIQSNTVDSPSAFINLINCEVLWPIYLRPKYHNFVIRFRLFFVIRFRLLLEKERKPSSGTENFSCKEVLTKFAQIHSSRKNCLKLCQLVCNTYTYIVN